MPAVQPAHSDESATQFALGNKHFFEGNLEGAVQCYRRATAVNPNHAEAHCNLGNILRMQERYAEAEQSLTRAIQANPALANAYYNLGCLKKDQGRLNEVIENFGKALELAPQVELFYRDLSDAFFESGRLEAAEEVAVRGLMVNPGFDQLHFLLGCLYSAERKLEKAIDCFQRALFIQPEYYIAQSLMLHKLQNLCKWNGLTEQVQTLRHAVLTSPATEKTHIHPFHFLSLPDITAPEQKRCAQRYAQLEFLRPNYLRHKLGFEFNRPPNDKIRLGYLSSDFYDHATARLMVEIFELHDRSRFHVTAYSYCPDDGSAMRERLESAFDDFVDIRDDSDEEAARRIYSDRVDILIDLKGHTQNSRSQILALRPAPVQVNYLGYPGTMGTDFVDYIIADRFIIPPEQFEHYSEKVVWLPDCYQPNDRSRPLPQAPARSACGLPEEGFVFCCFNQTYKITPDVFDVWCQLLKAVPDSSLWLWANEPHAENNLRQEAANRGVDPKRLVMAPTIRDAERHLARLQCADLFLDTFPVNAHTTCSDALWVGLPVVTCAGETFPSRVAGSLLTAMGVPELITCSLEDYYRLALDLASDRNKLAAIRRRIVANRDTAPLFDSRRFAGNLESLYVETLGQHTRDTDNLNH